VQLQLQPLAVAQTNSPGSPQLGCSCGQQRQDLLGWSGCLVAAVFFVFLVAGN
jgi:hypothetical protein